jgi:hypothetical protein
MSLSLTLPDTAGLGDAGHIADHNLLVAALAATRDHINALPPGGMNLLATASPSAAATVSFNSVFTSTYRHYRINFNLNHSATTAALQLRMRAAAVDDTSANYADQFVQGGGSSAGAAQTAAATSMRIAFVAVAGGWGSIDVWNPAHAVTTRAACTNGAGSTSPTASFLVGAHSVNTAYDGITLFPNSGTVTGEIRVFGIANT